MRCPMTAEQMAADLPIAHHMIAATQLPSYRLAEGTLKVRRDLPLIGEGGQGKVYHGTLQWQGSTWDVAVKEVPVINVTPDQAWLARNELSTHIRLYSQLGGFVVRVYGYDCSYHGLLLIAVDKMHCSLGDRLRDNPGSMPLREVCCHCSV